MDLVVAGVILFHLFENEIIWHLGGLIIKCNCQALSIALNSLIFLWVDTIIYTTHQFYNFYKLQKRSSVYIWFVREVLRYIVDKADK